MNPAMNTATGDAAGTVLVIDSWLVDEGRVRGLGRPAERFGSACDRFREPGAERPRRTPTVAGCRPVTQGLGRFQDADAAVAGRRRSRVAALAVPAGASLIPVVNP